MLATIFCMLPISLSLSFTVKPEWTLLFNCATKSVIFQIDTNCSPFQLLNLIPFHIRPECLKLIYYSLISILSKYHFKTGTLSLLFLSSYALTALDFFLISICIHYTIKKPKKTRRSPGTKICEGCLGLIK